MAISQAMIDAFKAEVERLEDHEDREVRRWGFKTHELLTKADRAYHRAIRAEGGVVAYGGTNKPPSD